MFIKNEAGTGCVRLDFFYEKVIHMRQFGRFIIGGIENKIFNLVIITIIIIVGTYFIVISSQSDKLSTLFNETNEKQQEAMGNIVSQTMTAVLDSSLKENTALKAYIANDLFEELEIQVKILGDYAEKILNNPYNYPRIAVDLPDPSMDGTIVAQLIYGEAVNINTMAMQDRIGLLGNLGEMMCSMYKCAHINSAFISTFDGVTIIADESPSKKYDENGKLLNLNPKDRPWYIGAEETGGIYYTDVMIDAFTGNADIVCALPVYVNDKVYAVVGVDLFLNTMEEAVKNSATDGSFLFIVNDEGHVIFSPEKTGVFSVGETGKAIDLRNCENAELSSFINGALNGNTDVVVVNVDGKDYYMSGATMGTVGWAVITVVDKEMTEVPEHTLKESYQKNAEDAQSKYREGLSRIKGWIIALTIFILVLGLLNALVLAKKIVKPINVMAERVQQIEKDHSAFEMEDVYRTGDEIQVLAENFAAMSEKAREYVREILRVTAEKERIGAELNVATQIQADMLPRIFPPFPDRKEFDLFASMNPAKEVGGDFYDYFLLDDDHIALVMADVSGKGVPAALFMVISKTLIKNRAQMGGTPSEILADVNNQLCEGNEAELFVTVWLAIFEISTGKGLAANAGHEHPAIKRKDGNYELVTYKHSPALAVMEGIPFRQHEFTLNPGDAFFVYTDGVAEATDTNNELFGSERMLKSLNREPDAEPKKILENVMDGIEEFVEDAPQFDDITMLCFKYYGNGQEDSGSSEEKNLG